jgi:hypothetical protein
MLLLLWPHDYHASAAHVAAVAAAAAARLLQPLPLEQRELQACIEF